LHTTNGDITPTVNLLHREGADPSIFIIHTINGYAILILCPARLEAELGLSQIDAEISLTSEALTGGGFWVDANSIHGEIELKFTDSPVDSVLRCRAATIAGGVHVELDSAFEGTFSLQSTLGTELLSQHDVEDPAGKGRHRVVSVNETRGRVEGEIKWVKPQAENDGSSSGNEGNVILKALTPSVQLVI
jgi:hypothetical protein